MKNKVIDIIDDILINNKLITMEDREELLAIKENIVQYGGTNRNDLNKIKALEVRKPVLPVIHRSKRTNQLRFK